MLVDFDVNEQSWTFSLEEDLLWIDSCFGQKQQFKVKTM